MPWYYRCYIHRNSTSCRAICFYLSLWKGRLMQEIGTMSSLWWHSGWGPPWLSPPARECLRVEISAPQPSYSQPGAKDSSFANHMKLLSLLYTLFNLIISLGWPVDHLYFCIITTGVCMLACWRRPELDQIKDIAIAHCCNQGHCGLLVHWTSHVSSVLESIKPKLKSVCNFHLFHFNPFFHVQCCLSSRFPNSKQYDVSNNQAYVCF